MSPSPTDPNERRPAARPERGTPPAAERREPGPGGEGPYQALFEMASDGIGISDAGARLLDVNRAACEMSGYSRDEMLALRAGDLFLPGELDEQPLAFELLRAGHAIRRVRRMRRKDGTVFLAETHTAMLPDGRIITIARDVTERVAAERRLTESEARYAAVVAQATVGITITDADWRFLEVNPRATQILGFAREELLGRRVFELAGPDDPGISAAERARLAEGGIFRGVRRLRRPDGTGRTVDISARGLAGGQVVSILDDITDRVEAERRLAESEARYRAVVERATVGITVTDARWRFVEVNPRACEIFGRSREQLLRLTVRDIAAPGELEQAPLHEPGPRGGIDSFATRRIARPDGTERIVEISARDLGGGQVVSVVNDVTERVEAARRLAETERNLAKAQELARVGTWEADLAKQTAVLSLSMLRLIGLPESETTMPFARILDMVHPEDRPRVERTLLESAAQTAGASYEHRLVRPDGSVVVVSVTIQPVVDESGRAVRFIGSTQDISEQRLLELQLREAQKLEAVGRLAGGVAHDFNNLLTVILGFTETMLDGMPEADPHHAPARQILQAARRAAGLTQQLLAFSRRQAFRLEVFDLNGVLEETREILGRVVGETIEVVVSTRARRATIRADRGQIEQVLLNLALNARDAMPRGGRLELSTADGTPLGGRPDEPWVLLTVADTGTGMTPEVKAHVFEPFFTTKDVGRGTGLGLPTVHGIVSQTGGRIEVDSVPGQGTRFLVHLPCATEEEAPAYEPAEASGDGGDETVLLVEDDAAVRALVAEVLRRRGYRVLEAVDGAEATEMAGRHDGPLHLLVADVVMPGMAGPDLARRLLAARPGLRVLLVSGHGRERAGVSGMPAETVAFLQKPFLPDGLARKVRELLDRPAGGA